MSEVIPTQESFSALMDSAEAFTEYLETNEVFDELELVELHHKITDRLCQMLGWNDLPIEIDMSDLIEEREEKIKQDIERFIVTACELDAFVDNSSINDRRGDT